MPIHKGLNLRQFTRTTTRVINMSIGNTPITQSFHHIQPRHLREYETNVTYPVEYRKTSTVMPSVYFFHIHIQNHFDQTPSTINI